MSNAEHELATANFQAKLETFIADHAALTAAAQRFIGASRTNTPEDALALERVVDVLNALTMGHGAAVMPHLRNVLEHFKGRPNTPHP